MPAPDPAPKQPEAAAEPLPDWRPMWDFGDAAGTEARFREVLPRARASGDRAYTAILLTQLARTQGLQRRFGDAHAILDEVETMLPGASPEVQVRYLLERGRALNSGGRAAESLPLFEQALAVGSEAGLDVLAVDAAHMLAIAAPSDQQLGWSEKAMAMCEASTDPRCKGWLGPLYNNTGWTYHDLGQYDKALELWEKGLELRRANGAPEPIAIARWTVARAWRSLGRCEEALAEQRAIAAYRAETELPESGYVAEEIAECLLALGREDEARPYFRRAYELLDANEAWMKDEEPERLERLKRLGGS